jgi:hypothetical protein
VLKRATLCLFTYVAVVFAVHMPWVTALYGTFVPHFAFDTPHAMAIVADGKASRCGLRSFSSIA